MNRAFVRFVQAWPSIKWSTFQRGLNAGGLLQPRFHGRLSVWVSYDCIEKTSIGEWRLIRLHFGYPKPMPKSGIERIRQVARELAKERS